MSNTSCFVFDLDGTLCNVSHRLQWLSCYPKNWDAWNAGIPFDVPNTSVLDTLKALSVTHSIILVSGRNEQQRQVTEAWLDKYDVPYTDLYMRGAEDFRADDIVKSELADEVEYHHGCIKGVFDDRPSVVQMWRKRGVECVFDVGGWGA